MKHLLILGFVTLGLVMAMVGTARSSVTTVDQNPIDETNNDTCTITVWECIDGGPNYDGASSVACESACGTTMTSVQARAACQSTCSSHCISGTPSTC